MKKLGLLLACHTGRRSVSGHDDQDATPRSNIR
jgi:hypothetical protein